MNMDFNLIQQQSMKLVMTNELRQAITMLQYSVYELHEYLQELQLENPLIELKEPAEEKFSSIEKEKFQQSNFQNSEVSPFDFLTNTEGGLQDHLLAQLGMQQLGKSIYATACYIALSTDENGYLTQSDEEFAAALNEGIDHIQEGIKLVQDLDPAGVGARTLSECLLLQLKRREAADELAVKIVAEHLDLLGNKQLKQIAKMENAALVDVQQAADFIQTLNPKPGASFYQGPAEYVTPDVTIEKIEGEWIVQLNNAELPQMTMNNKYKQLLQEESEEVQRYLKQKQEQFQWIKKSIAQRQETIYRVTKAIVEHQKNFLDFGPEYVKPLTLKAVADKLEIHESTVSRATTRKYVQTPRGLYELKYFFQTGISIPSGGEQSTEKAKIYLKRLIEEEEKRAPLSDQKIMEQLKEKHGIALKRRTVAKYREELHIPSSSKRKRYE